MRTRSFALSLIAVTWICGCAGERVAPAAKEGPVAGPAVTIGAIYNLTGAQAVLDVPSSQGATIAAREVNGEGGLLGRQVDLQIVDGGSDPAILAKKTGELLQRHPQTSAVLGLSDTDMVLAAAPVAAAANRVFVTSGATSPELPAQVPEHLFLACFGDNVQAAAAAEWAYHEQGARTASVLADTTSSYTRLLAGYFTKRFEELGGTIVSTQEFASGQLRSVSGVAKADVIFFSALPQDAPVGATLLRTAGFGAPIIGGDAYDSEEAWRDHRNLKDIYFTTHAWLGSDNPDPKVRAFLAAYHKEFPEGAPDAFTALGYDTARLVFEAIRRANTADPVAVEKALRDIRELDGVSGTLRFPEGAHIPLKAVTILEVRDGRRRFVQQVTPEKAPAP